MSLRASSTAANRYLSPGCPVMGASDILKTKQDQVVRTNLCAIKAFIPNKCKQHSINFKDNYLPPQPLLQQL
ncbi:UNVERIFIED_CONTAM: hypothetical protein NCL1_34723 [Trichonephila clavipes]